MKYQYPKTIKCEKCYGRMRKGTRPSLIGMVFFALLALLGIMMLHLPTVTLASLLFTMSLISALKAPKNMLYVCPTCRSKQFLYK